MPRTILGRRVRPVAVEVAPGLEITILEAADADDVLAAAVQDASVVDPYAAILWPTAVAVAAALARAVRPGERILDLGAGTGLAALTAARLGARAVALDHDAFALAVIAEAAAIQGLSVETRHFDLHSAEPLPPADLVILADVLYEPALARTAARRVAEAVRAGARVLVGDPERLGRHAFLDALRDLGLAASFQDVRVHVPGEPHDAVVGIAWLRP